MQMHDWVQQLRAAMTLASRGRVFVLPQYLEKYIAQRNAERISKDVLVIQAIPDEYLYYYDK